MQLLVEAHWWNETLPPLSACPGEGEPRGLPHTGLALLSPGASSRRPIQCDALTLWASAPRHMQVVIGRSSGACMWLICVWKPPRGLFLPWHTMPWANAYTCRLPEAAFFCRTYAPSLMPEVVTQWRADLAQQNPKAAESLADPAEYPNLFPNLHVSEGSCLGWSSARGSVHHQLVYISDLAQTWVLWGLCEDITNCIPGSLAHLWALRVVPGHCAKGPAHLFARHACFFFPA